MRVLLANYKGELHLFNLETMYSGSYGLQNSWGKRLCTVPSALFGYTMGPADEAEEFMIIMPKEEADNIMRQALYENVDLTQYGDRTFFNPDEDDVEAIKRLL